MVKCILRITKSTQNITINDKLTVWLTKEDIGVQDLPAFLHTYRVEYLPDNILFDRLRNVCAGY